MEEVDEILLSQLREIGCELDEVQSLSELDSIQLMKCVTQCLGRILADLPESNSSLPKVETICEAMNMSTKYKLANQLCTSIQNFGYKSDIGYQTFMYGNEHEIRRLLLFLIERIPREDEKCSNSSYDADSVLDRISLVQKLQNMNLNTVWIPHSWPNSDESDQEEEFDELHRYGSESDLHDHYEQQLSNNTTHHLLGFKVSSFLAKSCAKPLQQYARFKLSNLTIDNEEHSLLLPRTVMDILEWNNHHNRASQLDEDDNSATAAMQSYIIRYGNEGHKQLINYECNSMLNKSHLDLNFKFTSDTSSLKLPLSNEDLTVETQQNQDETKRLTKEEQYALSLEQLREQLQEYEQQNKHFQEKQNQLTNCEAVYQEKCKLFEASYKSKEELETGVATIKSQIEEIASTWEEIQKRLLAELKIKHSQTIAQNEEYHSKQLRIGTLKKSISVKLKEIQSKEALLSELTAKMPQQWPPSRASYTRRILEIIGNVKKQNDETKKVLLETKAIQKEINTLNGKIARSFTVSEDIIYREAKLNEWNRKCYRSLALLQNTFDQLLELVSKVGMHLREIRQLEEMVDNEKSRKTASNLVRINADLQQIELENEQLRAKMCESVR